MLLLDLPKNKSADPLTRRPGIFCVIEHAYQDRSIAEAVCQGRFDITGVKLNLGLEIDWLKNPFEKDIEWQIEWHKFYYGLDMAYAYSVSGDDKFLDNWVNLVWSFIRQVPVHFASTDVLARRIQNWIYARQIFINSRHFAGFPSGFEEELYSSIKEQTVYLRSNLTSERNHRTLELYALFIVSLAFPRIERETKLLSFAMQGLLENLISDIKEDGVQREQSTHYHCTVLRSFLGARENARRFGLRFSNEFDERLFKACEFALHIHRPDGQIPAISDSDTGSYLDLLKLAGQIFSRPDFTYAGTCGTEGLAPQKRNVNFCKAGYFIQRSGWGSSDTSFKNERFLIFDCGPIGDGGHGHYDLLNIEISACGKPLIVDSGRYTYAEDENFNWRHFFKGTAAHNTVVVDGKDQTPYRRGKPKGETARGLFLERVSKPGVDVLCGMAVSPSYEAIHTRRVFFIRNKFWLIEDQLAGQSDHSYDLRFHLTPSAWNRCSVIRTEENTVVRTPNVALLFEIGRNPSIQPSWFAPQYGIKHRAPCVSVLSENAASAHFYTLIMPLCIKEAMPGFTVETEGARTMVTISIDNENSENLSWEIRDNHVEGLRLT